HVHLAVHVRRNAQVLTGVLMVSSTLIKLAKAKMTVGNQGAHAAQFSEGKGLAVMGLATLSVEAVGVGGDVAEEVLNPGCGPEVSPHMFDCAVAQISRFIKPAEP